MSIVGHKCGVAQLATPNPTIFQGPRWRRFIDFAQFSPISHAQRGETRDRQQTLNGACLHAITNVDKTLQNPHLRVLSTKSESVTPRYEIEHTEVKRETPALVHPSASNNYHCCFRGQTFENCTLPLPTQARYSTPIYQSYTMSPIVQSTPAYKSTTMLMPATRISAAIRTMTIHSRYSPRSMSVTPVSNVSRSTLLTMRMRKLVL